MKELTSTKPQPTQGQTHRQARVRPGARTDLDRTRFRLLLPWTQQTAQYQALHGLTGSIISSGSCPLPCVRTKGDDDERKANKPKGQYQKRSGWVACRSGIVLSSAMYVVYPMFRFSLRLMHTSSSFSGLATFPFLGSGLVLDALHCTLHAPAALDHGHEISMTAWMGNGGCTAIRYRGALRYCTSRQDCKVLRTSPWSCCSAR